MEFVSPDLSAGADPGRPSFFELAAQDQLRDLLHPVTRYIVSVMAQRHPRYLLRLHRWHDEAYLVLMLFLERHYLRHHLASFAENFYGLKRRRRPGVSSSRAQAAVDLFTNHERLRPRDIRWSLLFLVGVPYLRTKARDAYERLGGGIEADLFAEPSAPSMSTSDLPRRERWVKRTQDAYKLVYPYANTLYELMLLGYNVAYIFEKTASYRPWLQWLNVDIRRLSAHDHKRAQATVVEVLLSPLRRHPYSGRPPSAALVILRYLMLIPRYAFEAFKIVLPTTIFAFKWWYSSDYARSRRGGGAAPTEPPLKPPTRLALPIDGALRGGKRVLAPGECPICSTRPAVNPTSLPTGWLACYRCAFTYVSAYGRCPVMLTRADVGSLRKVVG